MHRKLHVLYLLQGFDKSENRQLFLTVQSIKYCHILNFETALLCNLFKIMCLSTNNKRMKTNIQCRPR